MSGGTEFSMSLRLVNTMAIFYGTNLICVIKAMMGSCSVGRINILEWPGYDIFLLNLSLPVRNTSYEPLLYKSSSVCINGLESQGKKSVWSAS